MIDLNSKVFLMEQKKLYYNCLIAIFVVTKLITQTFITPELFLVVKRQLFKNGCILVAKQYFENPSFMI